ncbi:DsbA family oxidoreductase [Calidifontibacter sp. DB0510]|uniref:DsbA family oxidoreductase n=1 Tax=Metallococcus carri TaxID=1656884 RepID=A0A967B1J4_9MICO|nr:DsbA family oxidoreductase [Metallococcus carri]NHN57104.1 DsbA family oxidoreductase [Metallococcus carri]NOP39027.1 DsbA family oxidoreductase [Calidifontibacter sp. DB2511S]
MTATPSATSTASPPAAAPRNDRVGGSVHPLVKVDIWSDIACPWCYIGKRRFEAGLRAFAHANDVEIAWHSYQLDPTLPEHYDGTEVDYLSERKGMPRAAVERMTAHVTQQAAEVGLDYDFDNLVVANSLRAHRLLHLAARHGVADAVKEDLLSAHFERGVDIGDPDALVAIGAAHGLDADEAHAALDDPELAAEVEADFAKARAYGIQGVPFFVIDEKFGVSGAQPAEAFTSALEHAWADAHPLVMPVAEGAVCGPDGCDPA